MNSWKGAGGRGKVVGLGSVVGDVEGIIEDIAAC